MKDLNLTPDPLPASGSITRRRVIWMAAAGVAAPGAMLGTAHATPTLVAGDRLTEEGADGAPCALKLSDLKPGKPVLAWPLDTRTGKPRDGSRLNKIVLIRLPEAEMSDATRGLSAGGVIAYSALCTHQACDVKTWMAKEKALVCFCHASKFALLQEGKVVGGPATRTLPAIPLTLAGDELVLAGGFTAPPGGSPV